MAKPRKAITDLSDDEIKRKLGLMRILQEKKKFGRIEDFAPYPKQLEFLRLGATKRERLLMAANRIGKSELGAYEAACHLTGWYPKPGHAFYPDTEAMRKAGLAGKDAFPNGWQGRRFAKATMGWVAGVTARDVRNVCQTKLCGPYGVDADFGSGMIPRAAFADKPSTARGVTDVYDTIQVKHISGGVSKAMFLSYETGREKFQGEGLDWIWLDEEPPLDIYSEALTRIGERDGVAFMTFTPLFGRSKVVLRFLDEPSSDRAVTTIVIEEAPHISAETRARMVSGYLPHEREARARGVPALGSGPIFTAPEESVVEPPIERVPEFWFKLWGVDFGIGHPFGAALILWDKDNDVIHVHHTYRVADALPIQHADALKRVGIDVPVAWPQDGTERRDDGKPLSDHYRRNGLKMLSEHATWPDGSVSTEAGILEIDEREKSGRLKYSAHLSDILEERRFYHRKDGKIVKLKDDLMSALRVAITMKRAARQVQLGSKRPASGGPGAGLAQGVDFDVFA